RQTALQPGELVVAVHVPAHPEGAFSRFGKLGSRRYLVISVAMIAITIIPDASGRIGDARIAVGACSPVARRIPALEAELAGQPLAGDPGRLVRKEQLCVLAPIGDVRGTAEYRLDAVAEMLRRMLGALAARESAA
ncbi:MAG: FAD binding domain-containing protein, partial [Paracoccaceae bacterium]